MSWGKRLRVVGLGLLGLAGLALLGAAGTVLWLRTTSGNEFIRGRIDGAVDLAMTGGDFQIGSLSTDLFTYWTVGGLEVIDEHGRTVAAIDQVTAELQPLALVRGTLHLEEVALVGVAVDLRRGEDGRLDVQRLFGLGESDEPAAPWEGLPVDVELDHFILDGAAFELSGEEVQASLGGLDVTASASVIGRVVRVENIVMSTEVAVPDLGPVRASGGVVYDGERVDLDGLLVELGQGELALSGAVTGLATTPELDLKLGANPFDLAPIDAFADAGLGGLWEGELGLTGPLDAAALSGRLDGVQGSEGGLTIDVTVDLTDSEVPWQGTLVAESFHVEDAVAKVGEEPLVISGTLTASGQGSTFPDGFAATGTFEGTEVRAYGVEIDEGTATLEVRDGRIHWGDVITDGPLGPLTAEGSYGLQDGQVATAIRGRVALAELERFGASDLRGRADLNLQVSVDTTEDGVPTWVSGRIVAAPFLFGDDVVFQRVVAGVDVRVVDGRTSVDVELDATDGEAYGVEIARYQDSLVHVDLVDGATVATGDGTFTTLAVPSVAEVVDGRASWQFELDADGAMRVDAHLEHGRHEILMAKGAHGVMDVRLANDVAHVVADFRSRDEPTLQTVLDFDLNTSTLDADSLVVQVAPGSVWSADKPVSLRLADEGGGVRNAVIALSSDEGAVEVSGDVGMAGGLDGTVKVRGLDLGLVSVLAELEEPLTGRLDVDLALSGDASDASVDATDIRLTGFDGDLGLTGRVEGYGGKLYPRLDLTVVDELLASVGGELPVSLDLAGPGLDPDGAVDLEVALRAGSISRLERWAGDPLPPGETSGSIEVTGVLGDPDLRAAGVAELDAAGWKRRARVEWQVSREDSELVYWADVFEGFQRRADLAGTAETGASEIFAWALRGANEPLWDDLDLYARSLDGEVALKAVPAQSLFALAGADLDVAGELTGGLTLSGSATKPVAQTAIRWHGGRVGDAELSHASFELEHFDDTYLPIAALQFAEGGSLFVGGEVPMAVDLSAEDWSTWNTGDLDLAIGGEGLPLALGSGFDAGIQGADGLMVVDGTVKGTLSSPKPDVKVSIVDGRLDYLPLGLRVLDLNLEGSASEHLVGLKTLQANSVPLRRNLKSGLLEVREESHTPIVATGSMQINDWVPGVVRGSLRLDNALLSALDDQLLRLSGAITVSQEWPAVSVDGLLKVDQGFVGLDSTAFFSTASLALDDNLLVIRDGGVNAEAVEVAEEPEEPPLYEHFDVGVVVDLNRAVEADIVMPFIDDLGALGASLTSANVSVRVDGEGNLGMQNGELSLLGEVEVIDGTARVLQSNFDLSSGVISFIGDDFSNPVLDLSGSMAVSGGQVNMNVRGVPSSPEIAFSSEEYPDQQQILSILLTGRAPDELSGNGAVAAASGLLIQSVLGGTSLGGFTVEPDGTISVGVPVAQAVFVRTRFSAKTEQNENRVSVVAEWSLARRLVLEAAWGDLHSWGDLYWELRF